MKTSDEVRSFTVAADDDGIRVDRWFKRHLPQVGFGTVSKWARTGQVRVDGKRVKPDDRLVEGQQIRVPPGGDAPHKKDKPKRELSKAEIEQAEGMVIEKTKGALVLNKPPGLATQGGTNTFNHVDGLLDAYAPGEDEVRPRLVHRLDKDTSGVLLLAKYPKAAAQLSEKFRSRDMSKVYWAITVGVPNPPFGQIRCWMVKGIEDENEEDGYRVIHPKARGRRDADRERMFRSAQGVEGARHSITDYAVISTAGQKAAWVALKPETGRMHQLRFHMLEMNTSILGDFKYQSRREVPQGLAPGMHLHARSLIIPRQTGKPIKIVAPLPPHMKQTFESLGFLEQEAGKDPLAPFI